jgi:hypothetical protein
MTLPIWLSVKRVDKAARLHLAHEGVLFWRDWIIP